ncbi:MAG: DUF3572 domain-containing protein [Tropicimonas sp.]|uniref:DUF3572 domain-containing protein n=1 Tax=Tropicimonas sp. TaxID=2067044 RepID=UPI003A84F372
MRRETAETTALQALAWLLANEELLPVFLGSTGASPGDIRDQAGNAEFLGSVLDFLTMDDSWLIAFCDAAGLDYTVPLAARRALPGGAVPDWT